MNFDALRKSMIDLQIRGRGIHDSRVLAAMERVHRHEFVAAELASSAYEDCPLPIGSGQTISQPYMVALMSELLALQGDERVLEIGTGSGYQTAILAQLCREVYSVERIPRLAVAAQEHLQRCGYENTRVYTGDGTIGLAEFQPYDRIIVTAGAPALPQTLADQLNPGGRLVIPIGDRFLQKLMVVEKHGPEIVQQEVCGCVFVPLLGKEGWKVYNE
ncbi:MAG: protein-L-isoaspartate(D-aspartate) O-methyltransferase [Candidatus Omnitrophica bacterium]|nr:protein-L-isoaspartate(D-aspartate) O-methyltransferase [Candidatus Omnitrophota bacterium]